MTLLDEMASGAGAAGSLQPEGWSLRGVLGQHPLFASLPEAEFRRLAESGKPLRLAAGEAIYRKGDDATSFFALTAGTVRIRSDARAGGEIIHSVIQPGETFGEISMFDGRSRSADAVCGEAVEAFEIDRDMTTALFGRTSGLANQLALLLCERLRHASQQIEDAMFLNTASRLAKAILRKAQPDGGIELRVSATQKQLGDMIGLSRESTNKQIQVWVRRGWIATEKGGLIIRDPAAIAGCAGASAR